MDIVLLFGAVAGAVWLLIFARTLGLMGGCLLTLLLGIVFGSEFYSVGPVHAGRLALVALVGCYIAMRKVGLADPKRLSRVDFAFGMFIACLVLSTITTDLGFEEGRSIKRLLFFNLLPAAMYWVSRNMESRPGAIVAMFWGVMWFGVYLSLTSVAEKTGQYGLVFPSYITSGANYEFLGRGRGPLLNPSANGILICAGWFSLWMLWPHVRQFGRLFIVTCSVVFAAGIFCTLTRCVWLGAMLGIAVMIYFALPKRVFGVISMAALMVAILLGPLIIEKGSRFKRDKDVSVDEMASSATLRPMLAIVAWEIFKDYPLTGVGFGQYKKYDRYYLGSENYGMPLERLRPYHQHNIFLSYLTEVGLIGMSIFAALFFGWMLYAKRLWDAVDAPLEMRQLGLFYIAFMLSWLCNAMFQDVSIMTMVNMVLFFFSGLLVGCYVKYVAKAPEPATLAPAESQLTATEQAVAA
ncbi:MAG: O-antigen ligase family protein [Planctomycetota bacterium]